MREDLLDSFLPRPLTRYPVALWACALALWLLSLQTGYGTYVDASDSRLVYLGAWRAEGPSQYTLYPGSQVRIRVSGQATLDIRAYPNDPSKLRIRPLGSNAGGTVRHINQSVVLDAPDHPVEFEVNYMAYETGRAFASSHPRFQLYGLTLSPGSTLLPATEPQGPFYYDFTGDSITHAMRVLSGKGGGLASMDGTRSYGYELARLKDARYRIRGHSGESLRSFWSKIGYFQQGLPLPTEPAPDVLFFNIGANNQSWSDSDFQRRLEEAIEQARNHMPDTYILVLNFFNKGTSRNTAIKRALARQAPGMGHLFDVHRNVSVKYTDGIHPTAASHRNTATALRKHLRFTPVPADYDGDGLADPTTFWDRSGNWNTFSTRVDAGTRFNWGFSGTRALAADFDGDGLADPVVYSPKEGRFYIYQSQDGPRIEDVGPRKKTLPAVGDYDGDGIPDLAVYSLALGRFFVRLSSGDGEVTRKNFGNDRFIPVPGDYDGDGITDYAIYNTGNGRWRIIQSTDGIEQRVSWGSKAMKPVPGDYDGDGITDIAVYHPATGNWHILMSSTGEPVVVQWGYGPTVPAVADYDGDGIDDIAVYNPDIGRWYVIESDSGLGRIFRW